MCFPQLRRKIYYQVPKQLNKCYLQTSAVQNHCLCSNKASHCLWQTRVRKAGCHLLNELFQITVLWPEGINSNPHGEIHSQRGSYSLRESKKWGPRVKLAVSQWVFYCPLLNHIYYLWLKHRILKLKKFQRENETIGWKGLLTAPVPPSNFSCWHLWRYNQRWTLAIASLTLTAKCPIWGKRVQVVRKCRL